ncbi:hypothetical protein SHIRM173S_08722 [Streptomyces hirsutus]
MRVQPRNLAAPCDTLLKGWAHTAAEPGEQAVVLAFLPFSHVYGLMIQGRACGAAC